MKNMILECPMCNALVHLKAETYLNERAVNCNVCEQAIQFYNPDGSPLFLKLSIAEHIHDVAEAKKRKPELR